MRTACLVAFACVFAAAPAAAMTLTSHELRNGAPVPSEQTYSDCNGDNISPSLMWSGAPTDTKSFAVTVFDPDADGGWWHWIVFDIPPSQHSLPRGVGKPDTVLIPPPDVEGTNDYGVVGYGGPCPPAGDKPHHYQFTVWALDVAKPPFGPDATGSTVGPWLKRHALAKATIMSTYHR